MSGTPPPVLDRARVIAYAIVDESVKWTGRQLIFVDGKELGPVPRLALCRCDRGEIEDILVFHCTDEWEVLGCSGHDTLEKAKAKVEIAYSGVSEKWIDTNISEEAAKQWIKENCTDLSCSFCGREPPEAREIIESKSGEVRVCNFCIDEHYKWIHEGG
jgi:hypothetical protein